MTPQTAPAAIDLEPLLDRIRAIIDRARLAPGTWMRWTPAVDRDHGMNPYGCADAINLLSTLGEAPRGADREAAIAALQGLQDEDGCFREATHHEIHCTAHCLAALDLLDAGAIRPLRALAEYADPAAIGPFLDALDWTGNPWSQSHRGAGIYAALHLAREAGPAFDDAYFAWLWDETDPDTGFWRRGRVGPVAAHKGSRFPHLAGSFHYLFNHEHARRPLRFPARWIDTCLALRNDDPFPLGRNVGFAEIDWVYCLSRAMRQTDHRWREARRALEDFAPAYVQQLLDRDPQTDLGLNDLHALFGATCCLAELQAALPGRLRSDRPLHLVLDRRPFI